jgi:hypothetical protein
MLGLIRLRRLSENKNKNNNKIIDEKYNPLKGRKEHVIIAIILDYAPVIFSTILLLIRKLKMTVDQVIGIESGSEMIIFNYKSRGIITEEMANCDLDL